MEGQMNWEALGAIGDFVGAIGVVVTLVYLSLQIRSSARATEAQVHASLSAEMERVIVAISENDSLVEAMQTAQGGGDLTAAQRIRLTFWFGGFLRVCESHIIQRRLGSTNIGLEGPISKLLLQFAQIIFFRSMMKEAVEGGIATDEFLTWLDSNVLNRIGAQQRGAA